MTLTRSRRLANLAIAIDSAASSAVLKKVTDSGEYVIPSFTDVAGAPTTLDSSLTSQIIDSSYVRLRQTGGVGSALDSAHLVAFADSNYITSRFTSGNSGFKLFRYDATANQTTFQDSDKKGNILTYNPQGIIVFYNGVALLDSAEYTATTGTSVVLDSAASLNAKIQIASWNIPSSGSSGSSLWYGDRGIIGGGHSPSNVIHYYDITTTGNTTDFGDLTQARQRLGACADATYGLFMGGSPTAQGNVIDYVTISTTANATDFGDITGGYLYYVNCLSNGTYGVVGSGTDTNGTYSNRIEYVTIATPGNTTDFGDLTGSRHSVATSSDATYGLFAGGRTSGSDHINTIDYITTATPGNATDFGDLTKARRDFGGCGDATRSVFCAGHSGTDTYDTTMDYVATATPGNATDFGDVDAGMYTNDATNNATRGMIGGGIPNSGNINKLSYFTIQSAGNAADFGDLTGITTLYSMAMTSGNAS